MSDLNFSVLGLVLDGVASARHLLAELLELLLDRSRWVFVSRFRFDSLSNLVPFLCFEFLLYFLLCLENVGFLF